MINEQDSYLHSVQDAKVNDYGAVSKKRVKRRDVQTGEEMYPLLKMQASKDLEYIQPQITNV